MDRAGIVLPDKEFATGQVSDHFQNALQAWRAKVATHLLAALGHEFQLQTLAEADVSLEQRGRAVGAVLHHILPISDAKMRDIEQKNERGKGCPLRIVEALCIVCHAASKCGKCVAEGDQLVELLLISKRLPALMITILLASPIVVPCCLQWPSGSAQIQTPR